MYFIIYYYIFFTSSVIIKICLFTYLSEFYLFLPSEILQYKCGCFTGSKHIIKKKHQEALKMFVAFLMKVLDYLLRHACINTFIQWLAFECLSLRTRDLTRSAWSLLSGSLQPWWRQTLDSDHTCYKSGRILQRIRE